MIVKELLKELKDVPEDAEVVIECKGGDNLTYLDCCGVRYLEKANEIILIEA